MSMKLDALESGLGAFVSLGVGITANHFVLPWFGFQPSLAQSVHMGLAFFFISVAQRFVFRRIFRGISE